MWKKLTFKSKRYVERFIDEMYLEYSYDKGFGGNRGDGNWVTIKLSSGYYHFAESVVSCPNFVFCWTHEDRDLSLYDRKTVVEWLWKDRKDAYVMLPDLF